MSEPDDRRRTKTVCLKSWEDFQNEVRKFEDPSRSVWDEVWFRGQGNADWPLNTTLERRSRNIRTVSGYLNLIAEIRPAIETFTGMTFDMSDRMAIEKTCRDYDLFPSTLRGDFFTYLAHLRHCGFPSPLLDWSSSPYVAAYFAFAGATHDGNVAIYAYRERPASFKIDGGDLPQIISFGPIVKTHKRHFRQQSRYTTCVRYTGGQWCFEPHSDVFGMKDNLQQDLLWKVTIPAKERLKVLAYLDKFNLNAFTLFDSEEALLEMLAVRVLDLRQ